MSTDTAFALGLLALVGPRFPDRLRAFMLTVVVVDDSSRSSSSRPSTRRQVNVSALLAAVGALRRRPRRAGAARAGRARLLRARGGDLGGAARVRRRAGRGRARDGPAGLRLPGRAVRPRARDRALPRVPRAADRRSSRARPAWGSGRRSSPNERLQQLFHPWTSYVIVPLFALANAGIAIDARLPRSGVHLADHARDPVRLRRRQAGGHPRQLVARSRG